MNKQFRLLSLALCIMACTAGFVACGDDDDPTPTPPTPPIPPVTDIVGTWSVSGGGISQWDGGVYYKEEVVFGSDGSFSDYVENKNTDSDGSNATWRSTKVEGTWQQGSGTVKVTLSKRSTYDSPSDTTDEEAVAGTYEVRYQREGNALLAWSEGLSSFNLYTPNGEPLSLSQASHELIGTWQYEEQWPYPGSEHMFNQHFYTFRADGTCEYGTISWNSIDRWYNQGYKRVGHFVDLKESTLPEQMDGLELPAGLKGICFVDERDYMWDFDTQSWLLSSIRKGGEPSEYLLSGGTLYVGHYGMSRGEITAGVAYRK